MKKIEELLHLFEQEFWELVDTNNEIDIISLCDMYCDYHKGENMILDLINRQAYRQNDLPVSVKNELVHKLEKTNKYSYKRLLIDTLLLINTKEAHRYLKNILFNDESNISMFESDFSHHPEYAYILEKINKI